LITTPAQYRSDPSNIATDTERSYSQLGLQLFYSANTSTYGANTPALAAPPSISGVSDTVALDGSTVTVSAHITGDPSAGIQKTWVTYTAETGPLHGAWQSLDLVQDPVESTLWTGTFALPVGQSVAAVRYILQAANGVGLVGLDNNLGDGYTPGVAVGATIPPATAPTSITLDLVPASGVSDDNLAVGATLVGAPSGSPVTFTLGSVSITTTDVGGHATAIVPLQDSVGGYTLTASYGGDATHIASSASAAFSITKVPTSLTVSAGSAGTVTATLTRTSTGTPLPQQTVYFQVTGPTTKAITATTDPQGQALLGAVTLLDGAYTVSAQFLGTPSKYLASSTPPANFAVDTRAPIVTGVRSPASNAAGWNNTNVTVTWSSSDPAPSSGTPSVPAATVVTSEGAAQVVTSGQSCDPSHNCATGSTLVSIDRTAPTVTALALAPASIVLGGTTRLTASVGDATSGISRVEYFIGADPGVGLATPLTVSAGAVSVNLGATLAVGSYAITVRAIDVAGNRSTSAATLTVAQIGVSVSTNANRSGAIDLAGSTVSGNIAVFATPAASTSKVVIVGFYIDDPNRTKLPYWVQLLTPYDLNGTLNSGLANMFDSRVLLNGAHTLTVELLRLNGTVERRTVSFNVNNPAPAVTQKLQVSTSATR
ncbi:MAG TPA: hypothetical protein VHN36_13160, partial [Ilumatobacteraceae bacterium]|nr:hypothetical protein [Ilumatobacteraceae bacterium]